MTYQQPPDPIPQVLDAPRPPRTILSPDHAWLLELDQPLLPPIAEVAEPYVAVAGLRINPATNAPARETPYHGLAIKPLAPGPARRVALPEGSRIRGASWARDGRRIAVTLRQPTGVELWVVEAASGEVRRLTGPLLNAAMGAPCDWLPGDEGLICRMVPEGRGPAPARDPIPAGPVIQENAGRKTGHRTFTNLIESPHDEALFDHHCTSTVEHVALDGTRTRLTETGIVTSVSPSPDGRWLVLETVHRPYSYQVPLNRFPKRVEVIDRQGRVTRVLADLPLADDIPITFDSVRKGPRWVGWRQDEPATLAWVEALDDGDAKKSVPHRDVLLDLAAPFDGVPRPIWRSETRFAGVAWAREGTALVSESRYDTRRTRTWRIDPSRPEAPAKLLVDRSWQDAYADPGTPVTEQGRWGTVLRLSAGGGSIYLAGNGASPAGVFPFLDRMDLRTAATERLWQSRDPSHEEVVAVLDDDASRFVTRRQSAADPPNLFLHRRGQAAATQLTRYPDPAPQLAGITKEVVRYERADGVQLSATLYLPAGHDPKRDGPLPMLFWAYPQEYKDRTAAGQVTQTDNTFTRPQGTSVLFLLTQGYGVLDDPTLPIIGEGDAEPNDTYVSQLVAGARAAVEYVTRRGVGDPERLAIGGHSYGAFTAANLLAHSDLFRAGIGRSGAYNRTLTPFGFQGEQRSYWEATDTYHALSPFTHAGQIDEPLLLIHGQDDSNSGTFPVQSERLFEALKGLGATVRFVSLPAEDHGYRARESAGHVLWEMTRWLDLHVKAARPRQAAAAPADASFRPALGGTEPPGPGGATGR
jgi:dipeptidyl aminopeptidase/acylaminoacyl peptidase